MPRFVMKCLFMGISKSEMLPYMLKISRKCDTLTFFVSFSMTILAERGGGGPGDFEPLRALSGVRDLLMLLPLPLLLLLLRDSMDLSRVREGLRLPSSRFFRWAERDRARASSLAAVAGRPGVRERPRDTLRSDMMFGDWRRRVRCSVIDAEVVLLSPGHVVLVMSS